MIPSKQLKTPYQAQILIDLIFDVFGNWFDEVRVSQGLNNNARKLLEVGRKTFGPHSFEVTIYVKTQLKTRQKTFALPELLLSLDDGTLIDRLIYIRTEFGGQIKADK